MILQVVMDMNYRIEVNDTMWLNLHWDERFGYEILYTLMSIFLLLANILNISISFSTSFITRIWFCFFRLKEKNVSASNKTKCLKLVNFSLRFTHSLVMICFKEHCRNVSEKVGLLKMLASLMSKEVFLFFQRCIISRRLWHHGLISPNELFGYL